MRKSLILVALFLFVLANNLHGTNSKNVDISTFRYTKEKYYELLRYIKENKLIDLDTCPQKLNFHHFSIDLCNENEWP
ncbi:hypothetical protein TcasGA2_TC032301 [Tribolium castaneum]|uniref:Uncharacterized protein n=1 Tax=Tribolium castaneum TaxID=7070 RepID=A0A139WM86_TRICA|nr:hypothetical protein TcasGA2_TC032301 [Tribolium castaneum]